MYDRGERFKVAVIGLLYPKISHQNAPKNQQDFGSVEVHSPCRHESRMRDFTMLDLEGGV